MLQHLFDHGEELRQLIATHPKNCNWSKQLEQHRAYLSDLQHERLMHLLVTLTVALASVTLCATFINNPSLLLGIAALLLVGLLLPYLCIIVNWKIWCKTGTH
jgi:hypothetical protein